MPKCKRIYILKLKYKHHKTWQFAPCNIVLRASVAHPW